MSTLRVNVLEELNGSPLIAIPTGAITAFVGSTAPEEWLECNGQSTSGYDDLAAVVGANVPDLRGEFIRGWDHGRGVDSGRSILTGQSDEFESHSHSLTDNGSHKHNLAAGGNHTHTINGVGNHTHSYKRQKIREVDSSGGTQVADDNTNTTSTGGAGAHNHSMQGAGNHGHTMGNAGNHSHTVGTTGSTETRPRNIAMMYIIKT